jgi:citrate lyase subunit beta/citryl-CoA lyase
MRPLRSVLYTPASNERALRKAADLPCDAVILDLEDAVAPERKAEARAAAVAAVRERGFGARTVAVRVNGLDTEWGEEDLRAVLSAAPDVVLAPKIGGAADLDPYRAALSDAPASLQLWVMVETARAVLTLGAIAERGRTARLSGLVMGLNDLAMT